MLDERCRCTRLKPEVTCSPVFGCQLEEELQEEERQVNAAPQNLLEQLPDAFTNEQFLRLRQRQGRRGDGKSTLRVWKSRGYIAFDEVSGMWQKRNSVSALQGEICR